MALNSINTNIAAYNAQSNIGRASASASSSIARLSSGERITRAADDVAALSVGTSLRTNITTLRQALVNTSQGSSLLQVADGALAQITDILQRQKSIAVQAGSGSLSATERGFLNQEFQNLSEEIDRLAGQTNFNGVNLLDGSLSERVDVTGNSTAATQGTGSITFVDNAAVGNTVIINGATFTAAAAAPTAIQFRVGGTIEETIDSLVTQLNASTNALVSQATYSRSGNSLVFTADGGGTQSNNFRVNFTGTYTARAVSTVASPNLFGNTARALLFTGATAITAANIDTVVVSAAAGTTAIPFKTGDVIKLDADNAGTATAATAIHTAFAVTDTLRTIVNSINANTVTHGYTARIIGSSGNYNIEFEYSRQSADGQYDAAGNSNVDVVATLATSAPLATLNAGGNTTANRVFALSGGTDAGIGASDTIAVGSIGNSIVTAQNQSRSSVELIFPTIADANLTTSLIAAGGVNAYTFTVDAGLAAGVGFTFTSNTAATSANTEVTIGATQAETLDNLVARINSYSGTEEQNYLFSQFNARRDGNTIVFDTVDTGTTSSLTVLNTAITFTQSGTFAASVSLTAGGVLNNGNSLTNGAAAVATGGGISVSGIRNKDFIGALPNISATYTGTLNTANLSVTIGSHTYAANNVTTNPIANTVVRFNSETGGGFFDIQLAANNGNAIASQSDANTFATRLNAAFDSISFYQNRTVSSYAGNAPIVTGSTVTGSLIGTTVELQQANFDSVKIDSIRVNAPQGSSTNGTITITVNGTDYTAASNVGSRLGANQAYRFQSAINANEFLTFTTGTEAIQFDTDARAAAFQSALETAFGVGNGSAELTFQVGVTTADSLAVGINNVTTNKIYGGATLDVLTQTSAATASDTIDAALDLVTAVRAEVGALQSRFDFAAANVESSIQNQDAARAVLLDTDIATESTAYATAQVQLQAGIAVLAQANLLPQNLLKLIG